MTFSNNLEVPPDRHQICALPKEQLNRIISALKLCIKDEDFWFADHNHFFAHSKQFENQFISFCFKQSLQNQTLNMLRVSIESLFL